MEDFIAHKKPILDEQKKRDAQKGSHNLVRNHRSSWSVKELDRAPGHNDRANKPVVKGERS